MPQVLVFTQTLLTIDAFEHSVPGHQEAERPELVVDLALLLVRKDSLGVVDLLELE